jgi:hypothetical protein
MTFPELDLAVMGAVSIELPEETDALLELHMDLIGAIDLSEGTVMVVALHDSSLLKTLQLSGGMAICASFGDHPYFLLSVGGYHPGGRPAACRRLQPRQQPVDRLRGPLDTRRGAARQAVNLADPLYGRLSAAAPAGRVAPGNPFGPPRTVRGRPRCEQGSSRATIAAWQINRKDSTVASRHLLAALADPTLRARPPAPPPPARRSFAWRGSSLRSWRSMPSSQSSPWRS